MLCTQIEPVLRLRVGRQVICDKNRDFDVFAQKTDKVNIFPFQERRGSDEALICDNTADAHANRVDAETLFGLACQRGDAFNDVLGRVSGKRKLIVA